MQEIAFSMGIAALSVAGLVTGHSFSAKRALWSAHSQAAQSLAMNRMEQSRGARWDPRATPAVDELVSTNFPPEVQFLDLPVVGTNRVTATNTITISTISTDPLMRLVRVDCTWSFMRGSVFTNTVVSYRMPGR